MAIKPDYEAGTVSITNGTTTLTGVNTFWVLAKIQKGDTFKVKNLDAIIEEVVSNTEISLKEAWTGGDLAASAYAIRYQPDGSRFAGAYVEIRDLLANGNLTAFAALVGELDLIPIFTGAGALTLVPKNDLIEGIQTDEKVETLGERAAFNTEAAGFSVLVNDVGDGRAAIYFKASSASGDWSTPAFLTGPNGTFQSKGPYSGDAEYVVGDVVLQNGSSWIARVDTTGNPPPTLPTTSDTQWFLLAAAGNGFAFKGAYSEVTGYIKDDVVLYNNSSWIALQSTTGDTPPALPATVNTYWQLLAARGSGDVSGPAASVAERLASFGDATGKVLADSGYTVVSFHGPENLCLNGDFDVWQRGTAFSSATLGYHTDRWRFIANGTGIKNVAIGTFPMSQTDVPGTPKYYLSTSVNPAGTGATFCSLATAMDCFWQTAGRKVTLTMYVRSNTGFTFNPASSAVLLRQNFGTGGSPSADIDYVLAPTLTIPNSATWQKMQYVVMLGGTSGKTMGTSGTEHLGLYLQYPLNTLCQLEIAHVSLVIGDVTGLADPFTKISRTQTMLLCQRYYEPMITADMFGMQRTAVANQYAIHWWFATSKYKTPSVAFTNGANGSAFNVYEAQTNHVTFLFSAPSANIYAITSASAEAEII